MKNPDLLGFALSEKWYIFPANVTFYFDSHNKANEIASMKIFHTYFYIQCIESYQLTRPKLSRRNIRTPKVHQYCFPFPYLRKPFFQRAPIKKPWKNKLFRIYDYGVNVNSVIPQTEFYKGSSYVWTGEDLLKITCKQRQKNKLWICGLHVYGNAFSRVYNKLKNTTS